MNLLATLESTAFSEWVLTSMLGFPTLIALHSIGMAIAAGLSIFVALYLNRFLSGLAEEHLPRFLHLAMLGFLLNLVTGLALFVTRGTDYITNITFLVKMSLVLISAVILGWLKHHLVELLTHLKGNVGDACLKRPREVGGIVVRPSDLVSVCGRTCVEEG